MNKEIIELSPYDVCPTCTNYIKQDDEHICKAICTKTKNIEEIWEDCPRLDMKYRIREYE